MNWDAVIIAGGGAAFGIVLYLMGQTYHDQTLTAFAYTIFPAVGTYLLGFLHGNQSK